MKTKYLFLLMTIILGCWLAASCGKKAVDVVSKEPPAEVAPQLQKLQEAEAKRKALAEQYKAMQIPELAKKLAEDSGKDLEPYNSLAYREASVRGAAAGRDLAPFVKAPNRSSFLTLMALRKASKDDYNKINPQIRIAILVDALGTSKFFNTWGLPHLYWEDAAKAIIESGSAAIPPLGRLLGNTRDAPVWGSEEVAEYKKYKYRVRDYAMALMWEIQKNKREFPLKPEDRDRLVGTIKMVPGIEVFPVKPTPTPKTKPIR